MAQITVHLTLKVAWWVRWYVAGVHLFADTMGLEPDTDRMTRIILRGLHVRSSHD